jgi:hypothetical protein
VETLPRKRLSTQVARPGAHSLSPIQVLIAQRLAENYDVTEPLPDRLSALLRELGQVRSGTREDKLVEVGHVAWTLSFAIQVNTDGCSSSGERAPGVKWVSRKTSNRAASGALSSQARAGC